MHRTRAARAVAALSAVALSVPLTATPALAATGEEAAAKGAYFNSAGVAKPDSAPAAPPNVTSDYADGVGNGNLAVAARNGEADKISFLFFALPDVPFGSDFSKAVLTLPLQPTDAQNANVAIAPEKVRACKSGPEGFGDEYGTSMTLAPSVLCDEFSVVATATSDGLAYQLDLTGLAADWPDVNDGVALVPAEGSGTFQAVFKAPTEARLAYEYTPGADAGSGDLGGSPDSGTVTDFDSGAGTTDLGGGFSGGSTSFDSGTTDLGGGFGSSVEAPLAAGELPAAPAPETAGSGETPLVAVERAAGGPVQASSPTVGFWLAALLLAGILGLMSLVMGDRRPVTAASTGRQSRLSQALAAPRGSRPSLLGARTS